MSALSYYSVPLVCNIFMQGISRDDVQAIMDLNLHFGKLMAGGDVASVFSDEGDQGNI